jgi:RND family efflux transporter MFP subunit
VGILAVGFLALDRLSRKTEDSTNAKPKGQVVRTQVQALHVEDYEVEVEAQGVVRPHHEVTLTPQVPGKIVRIHRNFEDGAFFQEGEILVELEADDYETAVVSAEAQVARTRAALTQEQARATQAKLNWDDLGYKEAPSELVLRIPQLEDAKANFKSAEASLARTQRDLERTKIRAPFDGRVRHRTVGLGQSVGAGSELGVLFDVGYAEIRLPIAARQRRHLALPETDADAAVPVVIRDAIDPEEESVWAGQIIRTEGALDRHSLELFAIARVDDPFGLSSKRPPLRIGQPVTASIPGRVLDDVVALPRNAVWQLNQVNLVEEGSMTLRTLTIEPLWKDKNHVIVRDSAIGNGALLATTRLVFAPEGAEVAIIPDASEEQDATAGVTRPSTSKTN